MPGSRGDICQPRGCQVGLRASGLIAAKVYADAAVRGGTPRRHGGRAGGGTSVEGAPAVDRRAARCAGIEGNTCSCAAEKRQPGGPAELGRPDRAGAAEIRMEAVTAFATVELVPLVTTTSACARRETIL